MYLSTENSSRSQTKQKKTLSEGLEGYQGSEELQDQDPGEKESLER